MKYWAKESIRVDLFPRKSKPRPCQIQGPFDSREEAIKCVSLNPKVRCVMSGYGTEGPWFDVQWTTIW
jgi:hypothetical protein